MADVAAEAQAATGCAGNLGHGLAEADDAGLGSLWAHIGPATSAGVGCIPVRRTPPD